MRRTVCAVSLVLPCAALVPAAPPNRSVSRAPHRVSRVSAETGFQPSLGQKLWKRWNGGLRTMDGPPPPTPTPGDSLHGPVPN